MCSTANAEAIEEIVQDFVDEEMAFTAFDITQRGLELGTTTETHSHLKSSVHGMYGSLQGQGYTRTLVSTVTGQTWLYHLLHADISFDIARIQDAASVNADAQSSDDDDDALPSPNTSPTSPVATICVGGGVNGSDKIRQHQVDVGSDATRNKPTTPQVQPGSNNPSGETKEVTNREGRLHVGKAVMEQIKCFPGRQVNVVKNDQGNAEIIPGSVKTPADGIMATYTVNSDGRLRISKGVLVDTFGVSVAVTGAFAVVIYSDKVIIRPITS